ncbi:unnamed protein product [Euphydryas editha]|uniref:HAT C-terminal dimerisation domain-containing protein n=1 Tax=Euphydryas editha TaxID=104508 RepID=A0AAU9VFF1_EUPED|nr:unnamed protein product [Euphydryas editha]
MKKNKREIPKEFLPSKHRDVGSTLYGFAGQNTLLSHVPKGNKAVILLSSMHHAEAVDEPTGKPEIIEFYNKTKGGVDEIDKKCSIYTTSRRTRRWPMVVFYRILDISTINSHLLYDIHHDKTTERGIFVKELARSLVLPQMKRRALNERLPQNLSDLSDIEEDSENDDELTSHSARSFADDILIEKRLEQLFSISELKALSDEGDKHEHIEDKYVGPLTSENTAFHLKSITDSWGISPKVNLAVSDNAAYIKKAISQELGWKHFGCAAHTINLIVQEATEKSVLIKSVIDRVKILHDRKNRRNSRCRQASIAILGATSLPNLTPEDWLLYNETCKALKCFEEASKYLSGEKYLTASQLLIIVKGITRVLKMILTSDSSDYHYLPTKCDFVRALLDLTNSRFENIENSNTIGIATFLDPRFKLQPFTSAKQATLRDSIIKLVAQEINREGSCENIAVSTKSSLDPTSIFYDWDAREAVPQSVESPTAQAIIEIDKYLNEKLFSRNNLPLSWWKQNQAIFPHLAKLVRKKCNVLCTSVSCKRLFSQTGYIISQRRTRLGVRKVKQLTFLNGNKKYIKLE